jgi:hypothetical protein
VLAAKHVDRNKQENEMLVRKLKGALAAAAIGSVLVGMSAGAAFADPLDFTWNPAGPGVGLSSAGSMFTADNITISDYAVIDVPANPTPIGSVTESGFLRFTAFALNGSSISDPPGFNGAAGATTYQLYISFTATGHLNDISAVLGNPPGTNFSGKFDSLSFSMFGDPGSNDVFSVDTTTNTPTATNTGGDILLANGGLAGGLNQAFINSGIPSANVTTTFNEVLPGFFVSPPAIIQLFMESSFTNTSGAASSAPCGNDTCFRIQAGGGNLDFVAVPEPSTLSLLGAGLLLLGFGMRRRKAA